MDRTLDYGRLIATAWQMTWHHRFLWLLALFAGGTTIGSFGGGNGVGMRWETTTQEIRHLASAVGFRREAVGTWITGHPTEIVGAIVLVAAFGISLIILSLICQGVLGGIGVGIWAIGGLTPPLLVYATLAGLVTIGIGLALGSVVNAFFWSYGTLAYLHLSGQIISLRPASPSGRISRTETVEPSRWTRSEGVRESSTGSP